MDKNIEKLMDGISFAKAESFNEAFDSFSQNAVISEDKKQRILSSVMRKAGFEMKENITVKKTKKRTFAIAVTAAIVACFCGFTAYAVYRYNYGNAFKSKLADNGEAISGDVHELESTTQPFDGVVLENTFENIDFTIEGTVSDVSSDYVLVTARKKDGTPFAEGDAASFDAGLQMCIPCSIEYFDGKEITDTSELYWGCHDHSIELNDDGSLTIQLQNMWKYGDEDYDVILGFGDIFSYEYPLSEKTDRQYTDFLNSFANLDGINLYLDNGAEKDEYYRKLEAHKQIYSSMAHKVYEGAFIIKAHISENTFVISPEENECGMKIRLSGMSCMMLGDGERFLSFIDEEPDIEEGKTEVTFRLENGEEFTMQSSYSITQNSYVDGNRVWIDPECDTSTVWIGIDLSRFTDPYTIDEILLNGKTLWKR